MFRSRSETKAANNLGVVQLEEKAPAGKALGVRPYRSEDFEKCMSYVEDRAYDHLMDWTRAEALSKEGPESYVPVSDRKPFIRLNIPKLMSARLSSKLCGQKVFPNIKIEADPDTQEYLKAIVRAGMLKAKLIEAGKHLVQVGASFVRYYVAGSRFMVHCYNANYCYPNFDENNELIDCVVRYVYKDGEDLDKYGQPKRKWHQSYFGRNFDILFDNPPYDPQATEPPQFKEVSRVEHGLGFVQGEWFRNSERAGTYDGHSLVEEAIPFLDSLNYSLCRSIKASDYNQDPILGLNGMDEDDVDVLIRSSEKAWNMGREGKGQFIESGMSGVQVAVELRDKIRVFVQDLTRIVLLDPEKISGHAQSGKALEILHAPMVDLIEEMRPFFALSLQNLVVKMAVTNLVLFRKTAVSPVTIPEGYQPKSFDITWKWPPIFQMTSQDLIQKVNAVAAAVNGNLVSRRTGVRLLADEFGVDDPELELQEIVTQPNLNPFPMF